MTMLALWLACAPASSPPPPSEPAPVEAPAPAPAPEPLPEPTEPRYAATHVLIAYEGAVNSRAERSRDEAEALATELRDRALAGDDLETLAKEHSDGPSAPRGGRLGVYATGTMVPDFERAVASVEPGAIGPLVSTPFGFHVVRRDAVVEAKAAHVLVAHADAWRAKTDRSRSEARARAQQALAKLQAGASFAEVAAEFSDDSTAETGGDLGRIAPGQMIPAFEDALFALEPGALSGVVETPYGFHVIRRIE